MRIWSILNPSLSGSRHSETATGLYNDAFVESTMDAMDFGSSTATRDAGARRQSEPPDYDWYCIDGGSDHIIRRMVDKIKTKPTTGVRVVAIQSTPSGEMEVVSQTRDGKIKKTYSQVICTAPLGCISAIEIPREDLSYMQRLAIRGLNYDTSTKIALKFESRWWEDPAIMGADRVIKGGTSSTDIPIRTCVYPSYGFNATSKPPGVLLASYTWAQDAQRLGGLAQGVGTEADQRLVELTLQNLSQLHGIPLVDHYAYNWHNNEDARGAFALFGPGQFGNRQQTNSMFVSMKAPAAGGKLHFAGEATSAHHAWVLGALNSAWRAVYSTLGRMQDAVIKREQLIKEWKIPDEEDPESLIKLAVLAEANKL
ncbi:Amine oxidase [Mycena sanguinolenta]|uniref:Amine oxidase n=1 Tax=Mycena sanguinolenta TaxID=230812 RepID=A0A8H6Z0U0_9AGAR|nr:Amine oxidase [Mycena sanguinolenta]